MPATDAPAIPGDYGIVSIMKKARGGVSLGFILLAVIGLTLIGGAG